MRRDSSRLKSYCCGNEHSFGVGVNPAFWSPELKDTIEDPKMGWVNHDNNPQDEYATYGRYAGGVGKIWCPIVIITSSVCLTPHTKDVTSYY